MMINTPRVCTLALTGNYHCGTFKPDGDVMNGDTWQVDLNNICRISFVYIRVRLPWLMMTTIK